MLESVLPGMDVATGDASAESGEIAGFGSKADYDGTAESDTPSRKTVQAAVCTKRRTWISTPALIFS